MEEINIHRRHVTWLPFVFGCFAALPPWVIGFTSLGVAEEAPPGFVYAIYLVYFALFMVFPGNMLFAYLRVGKWSDSLYSEIAYITLSFTAKSSLGWIVFGGLNQPNEFVEE
eukprot:NODE_2006_length_524_cov_251.339152_g1991_i0.p1 GENE.NODE_2006_length_524_cov_251.339152_g1991_i0~~NODE_2006_length_524_cov_251.339152_g1991_i0.p1  ORF type:complete len:122 (-),score=16.72 NODE_2006_length_524_cov_251.339152_g1991_i0:157-492(-)